jgi:hypothetical protein
MVKRILLVNILLFLGLVPSVSAAPHHYGPAVLGGLASDWYHALGPRAHGTFSDSPGWFACAAGTKPVAQVVTILWNDRVQQVSAKPCDGGKLPASARASLYLPTDSRRVGHSLMSDNGPYQVYQSKILAHDFSANSFQDCDGNNIKPGTLVLTMYSDGWVLTVGNCPQ